MIHSKFFVIVCQKNISRALCHLNHEQFAIWNHYFCEYESTSINGFDRPSIRPCNISIKGSLIWVFSAPCPWQNVVNVANNLVFASGLRGLFVFLSELDTSDFFGLLPEIMLVTKHTKESFKVNIQYWW